MAPLLSVATTSPSQSYAGQQYTMTISPSVASGGGSAVTASLYVLSVGEGRLRGIQVRPIEARDIGLSKARHGGLFA